MEDIPLESYLYGAVKRARVAGMAIESAPSPTGRDYIVDGIRFTFSGGQTPFNSAQANRFINDKWEVSQALRIRTNTPHTEKFEKDSVLSNDEMVAEIMVKIESETHPFNFPIVIKPNNGSLSENVFIVKNESTLRYAIETARCKDRNGDKVLVQQYIGPAKEYRAICLDGQCIFAYEKNIDDAVESQEPNPIYRQGSKAVLVVNPALLKQFSDIATGLHQDHGVQYVGLDIRVDENNMSWVLEGNSSPMGLKRVIWDIENGRDIIDSLCDRMISKMQNIANAQNALTSGLNQTTHGLAMRR